MDGSYFDVFNKQYKKCKTRKDYKKLCKLMLGQFSMIDVVDRNKWKVFSSIMGEDACAHSIALAIKLSILEQQGINCDILTIENNMDD